MDFVPMEDSATTFPARTQTYTGTAGVTATWPRQGAKSVWVWCTTDAYVKVGDAVTATTASTPVPAFTPVILPVPDGGETWRVSAIQISAGGSVYAKPVMA